MLDSPLDSSVDPKAAQIVRPVVFCCYFASCTGKIDENLRAIFKHFQIEHSIPVENKPRAKT